MAIDFLIFALLLISFVINFLALSAFWVTPGLRTTANRFTINLLIINVIGCLILAPTLFLGNSTTSTTVAAIRTTTTTTSDESIELLTKSGSQHVSIRHNGKLIAQEGIIVHRNRTHHGSHRSNHSQHTHEPTVQTVYKCNTTYCREIVIRRGSETVVITEIDEEQVPESYTLPTPPMIKPHLWENVRMRCWTIDLAAALGALAVLLVVGDTWCAVTDPLRYHSRISGVKSWVFIALVWTGGIFFGILSAFRELDINFESDIVYSRRHGIHETDHFSLASGHNIFALIFAYLYFLIIILLPFGFVCGMYWRIFSEARGNGLRMRQNGSSPLLQSALNLMHHQQTQQQQQQLQQQQHQQQQQQQQHLCVHRSSVSSASSMVGGTIVGGLQMNIDQQQQRNSPACLRRDSAAKVLLPTISDDGASDDADGDDSEVDSTMGNLISRERNQNILLTLQTASGEIKRNYSARQLPLLGNSSLDFHESSTGMSGMRQVHSSPNLHKYCKVGDEHTSGQFLHPHEQQNALHLHKPQVHHHHQFQSHRQQTTQSRLSRQALQIPAIHSSPKALSYMSSLRHRLSNASSLFKYREESRAARISILVVIMFLVSYLPYGFLVLMQSHLPAANFKHSTQLAIFMLLLGNITSPIIFAYRNKRVRRGIKRLCWMSKEGSLQRQNSSSMRGSGFLRRQSSSCGAIRAAVRRNDSRISTYSSNSCKALSQPNNSQCVVHATLALRPNHSCSTIINFNLPRDEAETDKVPELTQEIKTRSVLQRGITIVEHIPVAPKFSTNRKLLKLFFKNSKRLSCTSGQACGGDKEPELTEV